MSRNALGILVSTTLLLSRTSGGSLELKKQAQTRVCRERGRAVEYIDIGVCNEHLEDTLNVRKQNRDRCG